MSCCESLVMTVALPSTFSSKWDLYELLVVAGKASNQTSFFITFAFAMTCNCLCVKRLCHDICCLMVTTCTGVYCSCLQCIIEWQMKKVQAALGNIMNLDSAAITVNNRLTALRISHSQRLTAKVPRVGRISILTLTLHLAALLFIMNASLHNERDELEQNVHWSRLAAWWLLQWHSVTFLPFFPIVLSLFHLLLCFLLFPFSFSYSLYLHRESKKNKALQYCP